MSDAVGGLVGAELRARGTWAAASARTVRRALGLIAFVALWEGFAEANRGGLHVVNANLLPAPHQIVAAGIDMARTGVLWSDISVSVARVVEGFALAAVLGIGAGTLSGYLALFDDLAGPLIEVVRPIPPLAFLPMFIIWFGIGELSKVLFITFSCFFPIYLSTAQGVRFTDPVLIRAARSLGATQAQIFLHVVLRAALPEIITGLRLGFAMAFFVVVAAELIAADAGLGYRIQEARNQFHVDIMFLDAFLIGVLGFGIGAGLRSLQGHLLRWKSQVS